MKTKPQTENGKVEIKITAFQGEFEFLSNFWPSPFVCENIVYPTNEHFFQAMKTLSEKERKNIAALDSPAQAKREGRKLHLRKDWESVKLHIMKEGLRHKFTKNSLLADMLVTTHPAYLIEGNYWGDRFWGVDIKTDKGLNWLGVLLMERRDELRR